MIVYNYDADLEVSDTCVRSFSVELSWVFLCVFFGVEFGYFLETLEVTLLASWAWSN